MKMSWTTAAERGLCSCGLCGLVSRINEMANAEYCPRCGSVLRRRKVNSISRTWALLIASYILYIPANFLTMMETGSLFNTRRDTIVSGVLYLWKWGSWGIAAVVFVASVMVPLFKMAALTALLVSLKKRTRWTPYQRLKLYRFLEMIGRWSMMDIYVVTILAAVVQLRSLATVKAGPGAVAFGAVVVLTMLATRSFDPRLLWDEHNDEINI